MDIQDTQDNILFILYIHVNFFILESSDFMWCRYKIATMVSLLKEFLALSISSAEIILATDCRRLTQIINI